MRALISGIAGFVGAHLAEAIRAETDWEVWGAGIGSAERTSATSGARIRTTDLREPEQARVLVEAAQPEWVFHLAAQAYGSGSIMDRRSRCCRCREGAARWC